MTAALTPSGAAVGLIGLYQRYLSPLKGFRCAHRARKNGRTSSCSQFAKRAIARLGVLAGVPLIGRRFARCAQSARALEYEPRDRNKQRSPSAQFTSCDPTPGCDGHACGVAADGLSGAADVCGGIDSLADIPACDCTP